MYYVLFTKIEETQLLELFFTKGVLEFVVKILDTCTYKEFLKIPFENLNCKFEGIGK